MTKTFHRFIFAIVALSNTTAHADFVVKPNKTSDEKQLILPPKVAPWVIADNPHVDPEDKAPSTPPKKVAALPRLVTGFGNQVPLSFACRQIVPKIYKVGYGLGVDSNALVDWKGGQTWPTVLGRAIKPLGLHIFWVGANFELRR